MQRTFQINTSRLNSQALEGIVIAAKETFGSRDVKITIEDIQPAKLIDQKATFKKMAKLRKKLSSIKVDPNLNLSALANEMLNTPS